jgi:hypothetical protein
MRSAHINRKPKAKARSNLGLTLTAIAFTTGVAGLDFWSCPGQPWHIRMREGLPTTHPQLSNLRCRNRLGHSSDSVRRLRSRQSPQRLLQGRIARNENLMNHSFLHARLKQSRRLLGHNGIAEIRALPLAALVAVEEVELRSGLYSYCNDSLLQTFSDADHSADQGRPLGGPP